MPITDQEPFHADQCLCSQSNVPASSPEAGRDTLKTTETFLKSYE